MRRTDTVRDVFERVPGVRYLRLERRASIGEKRNRAGAATEGAIIAHWDDDDWYAPSRLTRFEVILGNMCSHDSSPSLALVA